MITDLIREQLAAIALKPAPSTAPPALDDSESDIEPAKRAHSRIIDIEPAPLPRHTTLAEARAGLLPSMIAYLEQDVITSRLLCQVLPGIGKTRAGIQAAFWMRAKGVKVAYVMPRHEFFNDMLEITSDLGFNRSAWFHWQPRRDSSPSADETCHHSHAITTWIKRGHEAFKFCAGVCGFDFMENTCAYWAQRNAASEIQGDGLYPIVAIQHAHIATNHVLMSEFDVVIGDESPLGAYPNLWHIPTTSILPRNLKKGDSAYTMMKILAATAATMADDLTISGPDLIDLIGGSAVIREAKRLSEAEDLDYKISNPLHVAFTPYRHVADVIRLLYGESFAYDRGDEYIHRVLLRRDGLHLLLKRETTSDLPQRVIWLDATGDAALYRQVTGWRVESHTASVELEGQIYQLTDSTYAKSQLVSGKKPSRKGDQLAACIKIICQREGYADPLVVSYSQMAPAFEWCQFTYFHGNRGSNAFQHCDAVFILGTPMPALDQLELMARMIYGYRMKPFNSAWCQKPVAYAGTNKAYIASGLWADHDLELLLNQTREMEIIQSAHRVRPVLSAKPIWLMTALPVEALPPSKLLTLTEALGVDVEHVDPLTLIDALDVASVEINLKGYCTSQDLETLLECSRKTAYRYLDAISQVDPINYPPLRIKAVGRGGSKRAIGLYDEA